MPHRGAPPRVLESDRVPTSAYARNSTALPVAPAEHRLDEVYAFGGDVGGVEERISLAAILTRPCGRLNLSRPLHDRRHIVVTGATAQRDAAD